MRPDISGGSREGSPETNAKFDHRRVPCQSSFLRVHPFYVLSTSRAGLEWIGKVLCFSGNLVAAELHDADGVRRLAVVRQDKFGNPKVTAANDSLDGKALLVRLDRPGDLNVAAAADPLA